MRKALGLTLIGFWLLFVSLILMISKFTMSVLSQTQTVLFMTALKNIPIYVLIPLIIMLVIPIYLIFSEDKN